MEQSGHIYTGLSKQQRATSTKGNSPTLLGRVMDINTTIEPVKKNRVAYKSITGQLNGTGLIVLKV